MENLILEIDELIKKIEESREIRNNIINLIETKEDIQHEIEIKDNQDDAIVE